MPAGMIFVTRALKRITPRDVSTTIHSASAMPNRAAVSGCTSAVGSSAFRRRLASEGNWLWMNVVRLQPRHAAVDIRGHGYAVCGAESAIAADGVRAGARAGAGARC